MKNARFCDYFKILALFFIWHFPFTKDRFRLVSRKQVAFIELE